MGQVEDLARRNASHRHRHLPFDGRAASQQRFWRCTLEKLTSPMLKIHPCTPRSGDCLEETSRMEMQWRRVGLKGRVLTCLFPYVLGKATFLKRGA